VTPIPQSILMAWRFAVICRERGNVTEYYCVFSQGLERAI